MTTQFTPTKEPRNFSYFEETMEKLNLSGSELSVACGYATSSWFKWRKEGKFPAVAGLACECLLRRARKEASLPTAQDICVLLVPHDSVAKFTAMCEVFGVDIIANIPQGGK